MRSLLPLLAAAALLPAPAWTQNQTCYQLVAWIPPSLLRCSRTGTDYLGRPIWTCC
jgi:hypothetical protein